MVLLAERLSQQNIRLERPQQPLAGAPTIPGPPLLTAAPSIPALPSLAATTPSRLITTKPSKLNKSPTLNPKPNSKTMNNYPTTPIQGFGSPSAVSTIEENSAAANQDARPLPMPMITGKFKKTVFIDGKFKRRITHIESRHLVDNFVTVNSLCFEFVSGRNLKIRRAHPKFMQQVDEQQDFVVDDQGVPVYNRDSELIGDMTERAHARVEEDGNIWDEGFISFDQDIDPDSIEVTLQSAEENGIKGQVLAIRVMVAKGSEKRAPARAKQMQRVVKIGQGQGKLEALLENMSVDDQHPVAVSNGSDAGSNKKSCTNSTRTQRGRPPANIETRSVTRSRSLSLKKRGKRKSTSPTNENVALQTSIPILYGKVTDAISPLSYTTANTNFDDDDYMDPDM